MVVKAEVKNESCVLTVWNNSIVSQWDQHFLHILYALTKTFTTKLSHYVHEPWMDFDSNSSELAKLVFQTEGVEKFFGFLRQRVFGEEGSFQYEVGRLASDLSDHQIVR